MAAECKKEFSYLKLYHYFRRLILDGKLLPGAKMPSLRTCAGEYHVSRTTAEAAYLQLAADGYIISRPQSGYYVTDLIQHPADASPDPLRHEKELFNDLSAVGVDRDSFRFDLWRRYLKSALRQDERLLSYGEPQGEQDFREALTQYVRKQRNILCSPDDIVVGAGVQSLLQILCPLILQSGAFSPCVSFPNSSFSQGIRIFQDYGIPVHYRDKDCPIIYVAPAHMTKWGEIMPVTRRLELIRYASKRHSLVIEDDLENEFVYLQKPTPSLFSLAGGKDLVYISSFSRLLLPSIRISFMILPKSLLDFYLQRASYYNQTASKAEQIALGQFIRDGHLAAQTRRLKRLYAAKLKLLTDSVRQCFGEDCEIRKGAGGTSLALTIPYTHGKDNFLNQLKKHKLRLQILGETSDSITVLLSASAHKAEEFPILLNLLKNAVHH